MLSPTSERGLESALRVGNTVLRELYMSLFKQCDGGTVD